MTPVVSGLFEVTGTGSGDGETPSRTSMSVGMVPIIAAQALEEQKILFLFDRALSFIDISKNPSLSQN